jgi:exosortase D (VPLPA-CTERM-specific)
MEYDNLFLERKIILKDVLLHKRATIPTISLYALLFFGIYHSAIVWLVNEDWPRADYSYAYLIPFVVLYIIWDKRVTLASLPSVRSWKGLVPLALGLLLFWLGELGGEFFTLYVSSWLVLVGICWLHLGWKKLKTLALAFIFILAMFPFPNFIHGKISVKLQLISSQLGVVMLHLTGMSAYREGNVIDLGFTQLQVVDACSGLRYVIPLMILGLLLAYFFRAAFWKRAFVFLSTIPLAIVTNSMRVAITGVLYRVWGQEAAEGFFHGFSAWFIFIFSLAVLLLEMLILRKVGGRGLEARGIGLKAQGARLKAQGKDASEQAHSEEVVSQPQASSFTPEVQKGFRSFLQSHFVVAVTLLGLTWVLSGGIEFREKIPIKKSLIQFPVELNGWHGSLQTMEQKFVDTLDLSDYVIVDYENPQGRNVNFYVAYYESQRKGESIHSPATCLPGGGWIFNEAGTTVIPMGESGDGFMPVNRAFMQKLDQRQLSYYWFPQRGRILTNAYQLKIFAFWDALTRQRTDGALVRVITPVYEFEELADAEARLQGFVREVVPILTEFLPE